MNSVSSPDPTRTAMKSIPEESCQAGHGGAPEPRADDSASASSSMEVTDRVASLEQRVQIQEDEIQLLKSALADVVRRLNVSEEQHALQNRKGPTKARPLAQALPLRTTVNSETILPKKPSSSLPSPSGTKKEIVPLGSKSKSVRLLNSCKITKTTTSNVKRTNSTERISPGGRRESGGDPKGSRNRAGSTSSTSSGKKNSESKPKEPMFSAGKRRVTHCKVTVQVLMASQLLNAQAESLEHLAQPQDLSPECGQLTLVFPKNLTLPLTKSPSQTSMPLPRSPSFKSARSPSSYFQLCY